jgi:hypothetical protein
MAGRPVAGGGRRVEVAPERLARWVAGFAERHGAPAVSAGDDGTLTLDAPDGERAVLALPPGAPGSGEAPGDRSGSAALAAFLDAIGTPRRLGLLLVRRGGIAAGVAAGAELVSSKVDGAYVQSRTAAGGWSQQRFARRRDNQAKALVGTAADVAAKLLLPAPGLDALVSGGDRRLVEEVLADPRLAGLPAPARHLDVPDPRLAVLRHAVSQARAVHITVHAPA